MQFRVIAVERILIYMAFGLLLIDAVTGLFLLKFGVNTNLSILYKIVFLMGCLVLLYKQSSFEFQLSFSLILLLIIWALANNVTYGPSSLIEDFGDGLKLLSPIIVFFAFTHFKYHEAKDFIVKFVVITLGVLVVNIVFTFIGIGRSTYGNFGAKGFFQSGNSLSAIIVLLSAFLLTLCYRRGMLAFLTSFLVMLATAAAIGTKSAILGVVLVAGMIFVLRFRATYTQLAISGVIFIVLSALMFVAVKMLMETTLWDRILFFYNNGGLTRVLLSGRDAFLLEILPTFTQSGFADLFFGMGAEKLHYFDKAKVEIDPVDILFKFGFLLTFLYFGLLSLVLGKVFTLPLLRNDPWQSDLKLAACISTSVLLFMAFIAGHVLINGVVTFIWGAMLALPFWHRNNVRYRPQPVTRAPMAQATTQSHQ
ncbi:O-antigen ligase family protein [Ferrimonas balearica]|uniref:O-antigen ligase family protein n=1 Tax=Ferrimonas balearica TaxID=44012 RepID=UPI001C93A30B|nr:O-antigen ligase family protein [Ferrimonas balearica]MBY5978955.1 O-antigen ligase family protein [Ferrimonas balearica]